MAARDAELPRRLFRRGGIRVAGALALAWVAGCTLGGGTLPLVPLEPENAGFKMLRPGAESRACGMTWWPYGDRAGGGLLDTALTELHGAHEEADVLRDVHVSWRGVDLLVAELGCVSVRADVGRTIATVRLPMLGDPGHHGHH